MVVHIRKIIKISNFTNMTPTILIKFFGFIAHSKPNNIKLSAFPEKIPETSKLFLIFRPSAKIAPKPTDQSCSNSISGLPLQISSASPFRFRVTPKIKGSSHEKKILNFSKMALTTLIIFFGFIAHSKPNNMTLSAFPGKIPETR